MSKIVISVVLLLNIEMINRLIDMNKELLLIDESKLVLGTIKNIPHISLLMGGIQESKIPSVINIVKQLSSKIEVFYFEGKTEVFRTQDNSDVSWLKILNDVQIQKFQELLISKMQNILDFEIEKDMFFNPNEINRSTISWVESFSRIIANTGLFNPHITIGFGKTKRLKNEIRFTASEIAIFHLGNNCTCSKLIYSTKLMDQ